MSYPKDIEDYSLEELEEEIERRVALQSNDLCDYCQRPAGSVPECKHPDRHAVKLTVEKSVDLISGGSLLMRKAIRGFLDSSSEEGS